jgi:hypothetical protein
VSMVVDVVIKLTISRTALACASLLLRVDTANTMQMMLWMYVASLVMIKDRVSTVSIPKPAVAPMASWICPTVAPMPSCTASATKDLREPIANSIISDAGDGPNTAFTDPLVPQPHLEMKRNVNAIQQEVVHNVSSIVQKLTFIFHFFALVRRFILYFKLTFPNDSRG